MFLALAIFIAVGGVLVVSPSTLAQNDVARDELKIVAQHGPVEAGPLSPVQKRVLSQGYLVPDQRAYERAKAGDYNREQLGCVDKGANVLPKFPGHERSEQCTLGFDRSRRSRQVHRAS